MEYTYYEAVAIEIALLDLKLDLIKIPHENGIFNANSVCQLIDSYRLRFTELADKKFRDMEFQQNK